MVNGHVRRRITALAGNWRDRSGPVSSKADDANSVRYYYAGRTSLQPTLLSIDSHKGSTGSRNQLQLFFKNFNIPRVRLATVTDPPNPLASRPQRPTILHNP